MQALHQRRDLRESSETTARRLVDSAQDVAGRTGAYVQARMGSVSERAQHLAQDADGRVQEFTGRSIEAWTRDARRFVRDRPLPAIAITIGLGYILGKLLTARR